MAELPAEQPPSPSPDDTVGEVRHRHDLRVAIWLMAITLGVFILLSVLLWMFHVAPKE
jgi:hypothetical protein